MSTIRNIGGLKDVVKLRNKAAILKASGKPGHSSWKKASNLMAKQINNSIKGAS